MSWEDWVARPAWWPVLLLIPVINLVWIALDRRRHARLQRLVGGRATELAGDLAPGRRRLRTLLSSGGIALGLIAILEPFFGTGVSAWERRGVDVLLCLDVSRSMLAQDMAPDRLRRARAEIAAFAAAADGDRIGLVAVSGDAVRLAPLTQDSPITYIRMDIV